MEHTDDVLRPLWLSLSRSGPASAPTIAPWTCGLASRSTAYPKSPVLPLATVPPVVQTPPSIRGAVRRHAHRRSPPAHAVAASPEPAATPLPLRRLAPRLHRPHRHRHCLRLLRGRGRGG